MTSCIIHLNGIHNVTHTQTGKQLEKGWLSDMPKQRVIILLFANIGFILLFSGCYSAMHQAQVTDGPSITLALHPLHHEFTMRSDNMISANGGGCTREDFDIASSVAYRYGWSPSNPGDKGHSIGILIDGEALHRQTWVRGSYFRQFPQNRHCDYGMGIEFGILFPVFPIIPYLVISKDLGTRFTVYGEVRATWLPDCSESSNKSIGLLIPTLGGKLNINKRLSIFAEANILIHPHYSDKRPINKEETDFAPIIGIGLVAH